LVQSIQAARSFVERYTPRKHGTRVAQIVAASGLKLQVADVFESDERGNPVASADAIARAIDWLAGERRVPVVNISVSGPYNAVLERMVARARATGDVLVAAAGNEGPNAAPAFPAALDGVIAVTAVDERGRVYARANQGAYIDFAAYAVGLPLPSDGGARVSGTSYAAPKVSAIIARRLAVHGGGDPEAVIRQLTKEAVDLGYRGRDPVFGWGELR
jgi:subtilisin family serine protease